jgi:Rod binding domain-containing protein
MKIPVDGDMWLQGNAVKAMEKRSPRDTKAACESFEAYLLSNLLNQLRKTTGFSDKSQAEQTFFSMFNEKIGEVLAKKGIGITDILMRYVEHAQNAKVSGEKGDNR